MAQWLPIVVKWTGNIPDANELKAINAGFAAVDYDWPSLDSKGMSRPMRSPLPEMTPEFITGVLGKLGFPVKANWASMSDYGTVIEPSSWADPKMDLDNNLQYHEFMTAYLLSMAASKRALDIPAPTCP